MSTRFDSTISLGHVITACSMLLTLGVGWGVHTTTVEMLNNVDTAHEKRLDIHEQVIRELQLNDRTVSTRLDYLVLGIDELKKRP